MHFEDGGQTEADVILYGTGYQLKFPYLDKETLGGDAPDLALYQHVAHPDYDDLFFVGCPRAMCSMWPRTCEGTPDHVQLLCRKAS